MPQQQPWRTAAAEDGIRRARVARLAALADAENTRDDGWADGHDASLQSEMALHRLLRGARRVLYLIDSQLANVGVQVALLLLSGSVIACGGGLLVQHIRNLEWKSYRDYQNCQQANARGGASAMLTAPSGPGSGGLDSNASAMAPSPTPAPVEISHYCAFPYIQDFTTFSNAIWFVVQFLLDPGMGIVPDRPQGLPNRIVTQSFIGIGILYLAVIIGLVVNAVRTKMAALKKGHSPVVERGHTVILGWAQTTQNIVLELAMANEDQGGGVIVILADMDKEDIEREFETSIERDELRGSTVVFRSGSRLRSRDLNFASVSTARSIIAVTDMTLSPDTADAEMLHVALNLGTMDLDRDCVVVLEVRDVDAEPLIRMTGGDNAFTVASHDIIGRLMLLFVRCPGLARVYSSLLGFEGSEFYARAWPELDDTRWQDVARHFPAAIPFGIEQGGGKVVLNPHPDTVLRPGDKLIVIAEDDESYAWVEAPYPGPRRELQMPSPQLRMPEEVLMAGWRRDIAYLVVELDNQLAPGSVIHIMCLLPVAERRRQFAHNGFDDLRSVRNVRVMHHIGNSAIKRNLTKLPLARISSVMVLSDDSIVEKVIFSDSHALATLLLIRSLPVGEQSHVLQEKLQITAASGLANDSFSSRSGPMTRPLQIVVEVLDPQTQKTVSEAVDVWSASDFIQSNQLVSKMLAMISEEANVKTILDELLGSGSSPPKNQLMLKLATEFVGPNQEASFWELSRDLCCQHHSTLVGFMEAPPPRNGPKKVAHEELPECYINPPDKDQRRTWFDVQLIILEACANKSY